ncbi:MAG TPA: quinone-dependent dihydroorotate dehydrogenase, partial [Solirubrobacteraceae bacterium]|nr:quinone-dependent dihydroorotate dehydrogenase [Solirubrobacteraceae bacterium]
MSIAAVVWDRLLRPLLFRLPAETAHVIAFRSLSLVLRLPPLRALVARLLPPRDPALRTEVFGRTLSSPLGLAAGFDKDAAGFRALTALGFGFVEVGTITPRPQPGNPRPRLFRLPDDRALVNRLGFNGRGMQAARRRLLRRGDEVVGVNIGRNKDTPDGLAVDDYTAAARLLAPLADYLAVNVSSPNTPGLRDLQAVEQLRPLLEAVRRAAGEVPLLVKIAPDLADDDIDEIADLARELGLAGIIATNTTVSRADLRTPAHVVESVGGGGLSGPPLRARSLAVLRRLRSRLGDELILVAAGGVADGRDAWERVRAGATLVQMYTGFVYGGPTTPSRVARELAELARTDGYERVQHAVGAAVAGREPSISR